MQIPGGHGGGHDLVQQIAAHAHVHLLGGQPRFLDGGGGGFVLKAAFGLLPAFLAKEVVFNNAVKIPAQRAFALLFAGDGGRSDHPRAVGQHNGGLPDAVQRHGFPPIYINALTSQ